MDQERYENLDALRGYACIGIVLMHVLANGNFGLDGFIFKKLIPSFTDFTYFFMTISAFSMCCGYYNKFITGNIDIEGFYLRRYQRVWPFFAVLCTLEMLIHHDINAFYEWLADITLAFGLIPNNHIEVVGVGWFLGVIFVFYMLFPFFCFLLKNKKRAWTIMAITIGLNILCNIRFQDAIGRTNFIYSSIFFSIGGLIYLYRREIKNQIAKILAPIILVILAILYFYVSNSVYVMLVICACLLVVGISFDGLMANLIFKNNIAKKLGKVSMEVYLCHMFVYRAIEKLHLTQPTTNPLLNYSTVTILTIVGAIVFSLVLKSLIVRISNSSTSRQIWSSS